MITDLDQAIRRVAVPQVCDCEGFTTRNLGSDLVIANLHRKVSNSVFLGTVGIGVILLLVKLRVIDFAESFGGCELIEDVA